MSEPQRYATDGVPDGAWPTPDGPYILYADHLTAVKEARHRDSSGFATCVSHDELLSREAAAYERGLTDQKWAEMAYDQGWEHGEYHGYNEGMRQGQQDERDYLWKLLEPLVTAIAYRNSGRQ